MYLASKCASQPGPQDHDVHGSNAGGVVAEGGDAAETPTQRKMMRGWNGCTCDRARACTWVVGGGKVEARWRQLSQVEEEGQRQ